MLVAALVLAGIAGSLAVSGWIYIARYRGTPSGGWRQVSFKEGPSWQSGIDKDVNRLRVETQTHLEGYGWIDRNAGVVRIPIERAMERLLEESQTTTKENKP